MPHPITFLLGAGASISLGLPTTDDVTKAVFGITTPTLTSARYPHIGQIPAMTLLRRAMLGTYDEPNFEIALHAMETLVTMSEVTATTPDEFRPAFAAFTDVSPRFEELVSFGQLVTLIENSIATIFRLFEERDRNLTADQRELVRSFFERLSGGFPCRIFSLNYDESIELSGISYFDGFQDDLTFSPSLFVERWREENIHCHLHGFVRFAFDDPRVIETLHKHPSVARAMEHHLTFASTTDARERVFQGSIISGLRKTEKILFQPYAYYNHALVESIYTSPNLAVIGYRGYDTYLNHLITSAWRIHGDALRVAFLTREAPPEVLAQERPAQFMAAFERRDADVAVYLQEIAQPNSVYRSFDSMLIADGRPYGAAPLLEEFFT